jgi:hypothetical protein
MYSFAASTTAPSFSATARTSALVASSTVFHVGAAGAGAVVDGAVAGGAIAGSADVDAGAGVGGTLWSAIPAARLDDAA